MCTGGQTCLSRLHRATAQIVYVVFTPFRLSQISCFTLLRQSQMLPFCPNRFAQMWSLSPASAPQPQSFLLSFLLLLPSFFHPTQSFVDLHNPFWWSRTPASIQLAFYCICRCFLDVSMEQEALHIHLPAVLAPPPKLISTCPYYLHISGSWGHLLLPLTEQKIENIIKVKEWAMPCLFGLGSCLCLLFHLHETHTRTNEVDKNTSCHFCCSVAKSCRLFYQAHTLIWRSATQEGRKSLSIWSHLVYLTFLFSLLSNL